jgi:hypothetical protein
MTKPTTLDALYDLMIDSTDAEWTAADLPWSHGERDWTSLPTFGGAEPSDTSEIWSWDENRLLIGTCADDLEIIPR